MRIHTYVITTDAGSAPNYDLPAVTLAACKPRIRKKAKVGDVVLAFAGVPVNRTSLHSVVWAGVVAEVLPLSGYWDDPRFASKKPGRTEVPDNFYRPIENGRFAWQPNPVHGPEDLQRDTGGLNVLVFKPSWRFGAYGPVLPEDFGLRMVGRRGERVCGPSDLDWQRLEAWLNAQPQVTIESAAGRERCGNSRFLTQSVVSPPASCKRSC